MIYQASDKNNLNLNRRLMRKFRSAINTCQLSELGLVNRKFTWSSEREEPTLVRLDRCFCNKEWELLFHHFNLVALSSSLSDHCPVLLCHRSRPRIKESFHFENFWPKVPEFSDVVQEAWQLEVPGVSPLNILQYKLQNTDRALVTWSKKLFGNSRMELHMANEVIHRLEFA
jgi:hypothetical protein